MQSYQPQININKINGGGGGGGAVGREGGEWGRVDGERGRVDGERGRVGGERGRVDGERGRVDGERGSASLSVYSKMTWQDKVWVNRVRQMPVTNNNRIKKLQYYN